MTFCATGSSISTCTARGVACWAAAVRAVTIAPSEKVATTSIDEAMIASTSQVASSRTVPITFCGTRGAITDASSAVTTAATP